MAHASENRSDIVSETRRSRLYRDGSALTTGNSTVAATAGIIEAVETTIQIAAKAALVSGESNTSTT